MRVVGLSVAKQGKAARTERALGKAGERLLLVEAMKVLPAASIASPGTTVFMTPLRRIRREYLRETAPDTVACPLYCSTFDVLDVSACLLRAGYRGRIVALTPPLPDPNGVLSEVRRAAGHARIDLLEMSPVRPPRSRLRLVRR